MIEIQDGQFEPAKLRPPPGCLDRRLQISRCRAAAPHGAFTWGALQRLLEEPRFQIDGGSATSAGAMNAVILAHGLTLGGRDGAMSALASFWQQVASLAEKSFLQPSWYDRITGNEGLEHSPSYVFFDMLSRVFSPYQINPFNYIPLRSRLEEMVDFERLRRECAVKLFPVRH